MLVVPMCKGLRFGLTRGNDGQLKHSSVWLVYMLHAIRTPPLTHDAPFARLGREVW